MNRNRTIALALTASLLVAGVAITTLPASADDPEGAYQFDVEVTGTFPGVKGTVQVTDGLGNFVDFTAISVTSSYDAAPLLPGGSSSGWTNADGIFHFNLGVSPGGLPGDHTLTFVVGEGEDAVAGTFSYTV